MKLEKKLFYFIKNWTPPVLLSGVLRIAVFFRFVFLVDKENIKINKDLKNSVTTKDAYILATGPSLTGVDLSFLKGKDCFSVSNFFLHPQLDVISPKYHFFAPYHEPLVLEEYINWLRKADEILPSQTNIVLGLQTKEMVDEYSLFQHRKVHYLLLDKSTITDIPDLTKPVLAPQTSPIMVLPFVHYLGYRNIYLLGCDHNILKNYGDTVANFYKPDQDSRSNATSGDNWKDGIIKHLDNAKNVFIQYVFYKKVFESSGGHLINTSKNGWLDFIEYSSLDDISTSK